MCHMSNVTCHMSCVPCQIFFFFEKEVKLVGGGSVINGASPSSFYQDSKTICQKVIVVFSKDHDGVFVQSAAAHSHDLLSY